MAMAMAMVMGIVIADIANAMGTIIMVTAKEV